MPTESVVKVAVPDSEIPNLGVLAHAPLEELRKLEHALQEEKPSLDPEAMGRSVAARAGLDPSMAASVLPLLWRLAMVQRRLGIGSDAFVPLLESSLRMAGEGKWTDEDAEALAARREWLVGLLSTGGVLALEAKAAELLLEQQLVFCNARIVTDVRPVFDESAEGILGLVPFHTVSINCYEGAETRPVHIAMDATDVAALKELLERAQQKERLLADRFGGAGFPIVETRSE